MKWHWLEKIGASWEGFALEEIIRSHGLASEDCYFWSTTGDAELDLLFVEKGKKLGFEFKYTDSPKITSSMRKAIQDLALDQLTIIIPHRTNFYLDPLIRVCGLEDYIRQRP